MKPLGKSRMKRRDRNLFFNLHQLDLSVRLANRIMSLSGSVLIGLSLMLVSCGESRVAGKSVCSLFTTGEVCIACSSVQYTTMNNARGHAVPGIIIRDASLMKSTAEMSNSVRREFVFFKDRFFGGLVAGSYWEQQAKSNSAVGLEMMNSWPTRVIIGDVDERRLIRNGVVRRAGHAALAVDPADFGRPFTGIY